MNTRIVAIRDDSSERVLPELRKEAVARLEVETPRSMGNNIYDVCEQTGAEEETQRWLRPQPKGRAHDHGLLC